jgi:photosystem II stability/assembly factor-like uncharacterized protein
MRGHLSWMGCAAAALVLVTACAAPNGQSPRAAGSAPGLAASKARNGSASPAGGASRGGAVGAAAVRQLRLRGQIGVRLAGETLAVTHDGGRTWAPVSLPAGLAPANIAAVDSAPDGAPLLAAVDPTGSVHVYRYAAEWSAVRLDPRWPAGTSTADGTEQVAFHPAAGGIVAVVVSLAGGGFGAEHALFVSTDNGGHFGPPATPNGPDVNVRWSGLLMVTPRIGVLVAGPTQELLLRTTDGGASWQRLSVPGVGGPGTFALGAPVLSGSRIDIPVTVQAAADGSREKFFLLASDDQGATFTVRGVALDIPADFAPTGAVTGNTGSTWWVVAPSIGTVYETTDDGASWRTVHETGLALNTVAVTLTGPAAATAVIAVNSCANDKSECTMTVTVEQTTDGGATWSPA